MTSPEPPWPQRRVHPPPPPPPSWPTGPPQAPPPPAPFPPPGPTPPLGGSPPAGSDPRTGPPSVRWGLGDVAYGALLFLAGQMVAAVVLVVGGFVDLETGEVETLPVGFVIVAVAAGWFGLVGWPLYASYVKGRRSLRRDFGLAVTAGDVGWGLLGGLAAMVISIAANVVWVVMSGGDDTPTNADFLPSSPNTLEALALFAFIAVGTPIAEELFFRGLFLRALENRWNTVAAVVISSVVFGAFHVQGGVSFEAMFIVAVTGAYGLVFALLAVWRRRLGPAVVAHMAVNGIGVLAAFAT